MGILETAAQAAQLVQKLDNIELVKTILALQKECYDLVFENRELREKLAKAEETLAFQTKLQFRNNAYWLGPGESEQEGPICSTCWDTKHQVVRMIRTDNNFGTCYACMKGIQYGPETRRIRRDDDEQYDW